MLIRSSPHDGHERGQFALLDATHHLFQQRGDCFHGQKQPAGLIRQRDELEVLVEGACIIVNRVYYDGDRSDSFAHLETARQGIQQEKLAKPLPLTAFVYSKPAQHGSGNLRIARKAPRYACR